MSRLELLSLELFVCLFIARVLLKIIGLGQTHRRSWGDFSPDFSAVKQLLAAAEQTLKQRKSPRAGAFPGCVRLCAHPGVMCGGLSPFGQGAGSRVLSPASILATPRSLQHCLHRLRCF